MMRLNFEKMVIFRVLFFGAIITAIAGAIIWPTISYIHALNQETHNLRTYLEKRYESTKHIRYSRQKADEIQKETGDFSSVIFKTADQINLITTLENIAARHKITQKIDNLNLDKSSSQLTLSLNIEGGYLDSLHYLTDLEKINYFLQIEKLSWTPVFNRQEQSSSVKMYLGLKLYVND